jgi:hypothetical protein
MKYKKNFKRAQVSGQYVMFTVAAVGVEDMPAERKEFVNHKMKNLFNLLSGHPDYVGCFNQGKTLFDDYTFGITCRAEHATILKRTILRSIQAWSFDCRVAYGRFETMNCFEEDTLYYGGYLYQELLRAHKIFGLGKKFFEYVNKLQK